jgi:hypothetical protein
VREAVTVRKAQRKKMQHQKLQNWIVVGTAGEAAEKIARRTEKRYQTFRDAALRQVKKTAGVHFAERRLFCMPGMLDRGYFPSNLRIPWSKGPIRMIV